MTRIATPMQPEMQKLQGAIRRARRVLVWRAGAETRQWNIDGLPQSGAEHFYNDAYLLRHKAGDTSNHQADQAAFFTPCRICCVRCKEVARRVQPGRCFEEVSRALRSASSVSYDGCTMMVESLP